MEFNLTEEQKILIETTKSFVKNELLPHEELLEKTENLSKELYQEIKKKSQEVGLYACNMPAEYDGGGLNAFDLTLVEKELGFASLALAEIAWRPQNILMASTGKLIEEYLKPTIKGDRKDCIAMTEPGAGSDLRGMKTNAILKGGDWIINGTKHFISNAHISDFVVLFASTGKDSNDRNLISCFLVDLNLPGVEVSKGYKCVSHRGYINNIIHFNECKIPAANILGEKDMGFELINTWLDATRLTVAATSVSRAERAFDIALDWSANRKQFGKVIGKFQGVSFKLADMAMDIKLANLILMESAWKIDQGTLTSKDAAMAKLFCTEMIGRVSDEAIQICGGMGLMADIPLERIWRDARIERIWEGTSEIQRHIISRSLLRPLGA
ncbi:acyl-CoA dehydrogenase family protein [Alphaproteobacteria bacterium]|nr:acyl-CoA dehydrogenase family protein [Alphaproteobacteria bacterium]